MKKYTIQILVLLFSLSCFGQGSNPKTPFAKLISNAYVIQQDSVQLKSFLEEFILSDTSRKVKPVFDKIEISKRVTFGERSDTYYCVFVQDLTHTIKVAHYLDKIGDDLFMPGAVSDKDAFKRIYIVCEGEDSCFPEVGVFDGQSYWSCGRELVCKKNSTCAKMTVGD